jgi:hypothetical protein
VEFPIAIDSTAFGDLSLCQTKYYWRHMRGRVSSDPKIDLHFGGALAHALDVLRVSYWKENLSHEESLYRMFLAAIRFWGDFPSEPLDRRGQPHSKSLAALLASLDEYVEFFGLETDPLTPIASEFSFALPIPDTAHPVTGEPILWTGRIDLLAKGLGGVWIVDEKSTSRLGPSWADQWIMRPQLIGYYWAAREYGYNPSGVLIRGIGVYADRTEFKPVPVTIDNHLITEFHTALRYHLSLLVARYAEASAKNPFTPRKSLGSACHTYGTCPYLPLCKSPNPEAWVQDYLYKPWNPVTIPEPLF